MNVKLTNKAIAIVQKIMSNDPEFKWELDEMVEPWSEKFPGCTLEISNSETETEQITKDFETNGFILKDSTCFGLGSKSYEILCFTK